MLKIDNVKTINHSKPWNMIKPRVYFHLASESVLDNLFERHSRPYNEYRKLLPEVLKTIGANPNHLSWKYSQKAGCRCGCSPGFIIDGWDKAISAKDIFVEYVSN